MTDHQAEASAHADINNRFGYHRPKYQETMDAMDEIRSGLRQAAHNIVRLVPRCDERKLAIDALDLACMKAIAGLARHEPEGQRENTTSHPSDDKILKLLGTISDFFDAVDIEGDGELQQHLRDARTSLNTLAGVDMKSLPRATLAARKVEVHTGNEMNLPAIPRTIPPEVHDFVHLVTEGTLYEDYDRAAELLGIVKNWIESLQGPSSEPIPVYLHELLRRCHAAPREASIGGITDDDLIIKAAAQLGLSLQDLENVKPQDESAGVTVYTNVPSIETLKSAAGLSHPDDLRAAWQAARDASRGNVDPSTVDSDNDPFKSS